MPLPGYIRQNAATVEEAGVLLERTPSATGSVDRTLISGGTLGLPTDIVLRSAGRGLEVLGEASGARPATVLSAEDANARYGVPGELTFDKPVSESEAAYKSRNKRDELMRQDLLSRNETVGGLKGFGLSMVGQAIDPLAFATNFIPGVAEGRIAGAAGLSARTVQASRAAAAISAGTRNAVEAGVGSAVLEGVQFGLGHGLEGRDYSLEDALTGVVGGVIFGGGAGGALGAAGWRPPSSGASMLDDLAGRIEHQESRGNQKAVSPKGAIGAMQLMPDTARAAAKRLGVPFDEAKLRGDAAYNRALGREELRHLLARYDGDELLASAAYNAGPGAVDKWIKRFGDPRTGAISREDFAAKIPFAETRDYVGKVGAGEVPRLNLAEDFPPLPRAVAALDEAARQGALARAVDDVADGRMTDVGELVEAELARGGGARPRLDEAEDAFGLTIGGRLLDAGMAKTARGETVPVRLAIVEAGDLVASHDPQLVRRTDYPEDLAPRQVGRKGLAERVAALEAEQDMGRLIDGEAMASGAPVVARDGTVETRGEAVMALQRLAADPARFAPYRAALEARGHDVSGFARPVLVRVRELPMKGSQRVRLAREVEADGGAPPLPDIQAISPEARRRLEKIRDAGPERSRSAAADFRKYAADQEAQADREAAAYAGTPFDGSKDLRANAAEMRTMADILDQGVSAPEPASPARRVADQAGARLRGDLDAAPIEAPAAPEPFAAPDKLTADAVIAADPELKALVAEVDEMAAELKASGVAADEIAALTKVEARDEPKTIAELVRSAVFCLSEGAA